ncbi:hypothetical protein PY254_10450 [Rhodanobacter sp. AS-Z3]|uniref:hypothetical protein n=1 Tax=Rhodanobacter sp. AS-Z3 TaxID=3031330 RepID=UPI00247B2332|nr:hypothetical protein [Rhodanobacter sp. AS-Z3]WEN13666.1 hypothetical protein PY254_10450 [Rhodanobacter sp. AS-Z3]
MDKWKAQELFLWGAISILHPTRKVSEPVTPMALQEFSLGREMAVRGFVRLSADADPVDMVQRMQQDYGFRLPRPND